MIKNIIFDFGNVFLPLRIRRLWFEFMKLGLFYTPKELKKTFAAYEIGKIDTDDLVWTIQRYTPLGTPQKIRKALCSLLGIFDQKNFEILHWAKNYHQLFLLSNMNALHMESIQNEMGAAYNTFESYFDRLYFSHLIGMQKPYKIIYETVLNENRLLPHESLFIDDLAENIAGAAHLGIHTWHFNIQKTSLFHLRNKINLLNTL